MAEADEVASDDTVDRLRSDHRIRDVRVEPPVKVFAEEHPPAFGVGIGHEPVPLGPVAHELDRCVRERDEHRPPGKLLPEPVADELSDSRRLLLSPRSRRGERGEVEGKEEVSALLRGRRRSEGRPANGVPGRRGEVPRHLDVKLIHRRPQRRDDVRSARPLLGDLVEGLGDPLEHAGRFHHHSANVDRARNREPLRGDRLVGEGLLHAQNLLLGTGADNGPIMPPIGP